MSLSITVRGTAEEIYPAERAIVDVAVAIEGEDRAAVAAEAGTLLAPLTEQLGQLHDRQVVTSWSAGQVRVFSHRPTDHEGRRLAVVHVARVEITAEFADFERLSGFVDFWSGREGVEIVGLRWDVAAKNRRVYEAEVRRAAVDDAVQKAQGYANAVRRGRVVPVEFADPGMLSSQPDAPTPMYARVSADMGGGGSGIAVTPEPIVVSAAVDARFTTDT